MEQVLFQRSFTLSYATLADVRATLANKATSLGIDNKVLQQLQLVCSEYCANLLDHAPETATKVCLELGRQASVDCPTALNWVFQITDNGSPWNELCQALDDAILPDAEVEIVEHGMGLALIKACLLNYDYHIGASQNRLSFQLPIDNHTTHSKHVLIVDDSPSQLKLLAHFLEKDYQLSVFSDANQAMAWLEHNHCDLVLTDLHMPGMSGIAFRDEVKQHADHATLPFVFISGDHLTHSVQLAGASAIDDYLTKPIRRSHLINVIGRVLARHTHLSQQFRRQLEQQINITLPRSIHNEQHSRWHIEISQDNTNSGDFVIRHTRRNRNEWLVIGDHMGHGSIAKANGAMWLGYLNGLLEHEQLSLTDVSLRLNQQLYRSQSCHLLCLTLIELEPSGIVKIINAGMPALLLCQPTQSQVVCSGQGLLGLFEHTEFSVWQQQLTPTDSLHCFSDGVHEGKWHDTQLRMLSQAATTQHHQTLWQHQANYSNDDRTLVSIHYRGKT
ncbi:hypothetical protein A3K86_09350 [Photobacterium jeanii]|uniref:Response regulatory domain-containing protein n=1 Tax=Photobacterium jeanii TaxID=858640 RepID=A0A178KHM3_9GAMM|nr:response regulator [Photobacterium jeanii]OAN16808.1 hypothetical protein A3K86_09350 [Photobacterium jeanii]PST88416.1 hypothetical protein C9I91_17660 [Photobacterium jeanii]